jgi:hypothetical protein
MWNWFKRIKELNQEMALISSTSTTELPIPFATEAKKMSTENLDVRIKRAEKAIFDEACECINYRIEKGYLHTTFDAFSSVYRIDERLNGDSITIAMNDCINHLSTFGYTAKIVDVRNLEISWQYPKEITLNDIEWSV